MNTTFLSHTPRLGHALALTGAVTVDPGKPTVAQRLQSLCKRVAAALRPPRVCSLHPSEINLKHRSRL